DNFIETFGIQYEATYQPQNWESACTHQARAELPMFNWKVRLTVGNQTFETDYRVGHGNYERFRNRPIKTMSDVDDLAYMIQSGKQIGPNPSLRTMGRSLPKPLLRDVLYCLVSDADALDYPEFEEWAGNLGYDPDSRKGEAAYRACLATG